MRLTVGPLPPAVYWRRRAAVLAVLLAAVVLVVPRCGFGSSGGADKTSEDAAGNTAGDLSPTPSTTLLTPFFEESGGAAPSAAGQASAESQRSGECTDAEIAVTVSTEGGRTDYALGEFAKLFLKIKNMSARSCARDVGASQQELRIVQGAQKLWSSDDCSVAGTGQPDVRTLRPGEQLDQFNVSWNGRASTNCQTKPLPTPGTYQLIGRVGAKWSDPVTLTIRTGK